RRRDGRRRPADETSRDGCGMGIDQKLNQPEPKEEANTRLTMLISLIRMFSDGPLVSLNGSPTVSPTTADLWASPPLPPKRPASIHFLALSQAPPAFAIITASKKPELVVPISRPTS